MVGLGGRLGLARRAYARGEGRETIIGQVDLVERRPEGVVAEQGVLGIANNINLVGAVAKRLELERIDLYPGTLPLIARKGKTPE